MDFDEYPARTQDREKALQQKVSELRGDLPSPKMRCLLLWTQSDILLGKTAAVLANPLMKVISADVTKDPDYIPKLENRLATSQDKVGESDTCSSVVCILVSKPTHPWLPYPAHVSGCFPES